MPNRAAPDPVLQLPARPVDPADLDRNIADLVANQGQRPRWAITLLAPQILPEMVRDAANMAWRNGFHVEQIQRLSAG